MKTLLFIAAFVSMPSPAPAIDAKTFCAKLQPAIQPLVKLPLHLYRADDSSTDADHAGESVYVDCDFRQQGTQVNVGLHDDSDHVLFDDAGQKGYSPLPGYGDKARSASAMGEHWVDVVQGSVACEARLGLSNDGQVDGDWRQAAARMCVAAFKTR